jgi:hypothetical protein
MVKQTYGHSRTGVHADSTSRVNKSWILEGKSALDICANIEQCHTGLFAF